MSDYRTIIKVQKAPFSLKWGEPVCLLGSCFSENIGQRLEAAGCPVLINPFGIQYNPASISKVVDRITSQKKFQPIDIQEHNGLHFSFDTHSDMSAQSAEACLQNLNATQKSAYEFLENCSTVIITLGTAWYYELKASREAVANCFKMPGNLFEKKLLSEKPTEKSLNQSLFNLRMHNPKVNVIFTLSPVRHWKDGVQENAVSKAILRLGIDDACANERVAYFGAYEIMMDDLRDYRFYKADMLHPNEVAVDYIWEHFCKTYFDEENQKLVDRMLALDRASKHRPRVTDSEEHRNFLRKQLEEVAALQKIKPLPKLTRLKSHFE